MNISRGAFIWKGGEIDGSRNFFFPERMAYLCDTIIFSQLRFS